jgi:hypothetical protein
MDAPITSLPLITVSISQLLGKEIEGLVAQVTGPKWFADGYEPKWRKLKTVARKKKYKRWSIILYWHSEPGDSCNYTGATEGPAADDIKIQFTAEAFAQIQPHIK